jgi:hypothetical protein
LKYSRLLVLDGLKQRLLEDLIAIEAAAASEAQSPKPNIEQEVELARLEVLDGPGPIR